MAKGKATTGKFRFGASPHQNSGSDDLIASDSDAKFAFYAPVGVLVHRVLLSSKENVLAVKGTGAHWRPHGAF